MFKNPGKKLKTLAKVFFWISLICYILIGIAAMLAGVSFAESSDIPVPVVLIAGIFIIVMGILLAWLSSIALYAAGAAVDDIQTIKKIQIDLYRKSDAT